MTPIARLAAFLVLALGLTSGLIGCGERAGPNFAGQVAGLSVLVIPSGEASFPESYGPDLDERLAAKAAMLDPLEGEVLGRLNRSEVGELIPAGPVEQTLSSVLACSEQCYGAFDPTVQILWDVYDFELGGRFVSDEELAGALQWVDYKLVHMDRDAILRKGENVRMGLGPILPAAIADWVLAELAEREVNSLAAFFGPSRCVAVVGEVPETLRVYDFMYPLDPETEDVVQLTIGHVRLESGDYLATLGDDDGLFFAHGEPYHMVLNPVTGKPVRDVRAAVVVSRESCLQAAVLAYAVMVMGPDRGIEFLDETGGIEGVILAKGYEVTVSGGLGERFWR